MCVDLSGGQLLLLNIKGCLPLVYGAVVSLVMLKFFYVLAELQWPNYYFSSTEKVDYYASVTPHRFILFRALPVALALTPVMGVLANRGYSRQSILVTGLAIGLAHVLLTNGRAVYRILTSSREVVIYFNKAAQLATHIITIALCLFISLLSAYIATTSFGRAVAPSLEGVRDNFWSSVLVLTLGVFAYTSYKNDTDQNAIFEKTLGGIKPDLKSYLQKKCLEYRASYDLALAICMTEAIQRPKWLRIAERIKAYFYGPGTYGIMQTRSNRWINDKQSIDSAIKTHLTDSEGLSYQEITRLIEGYNSSKAFQDWARQAYIYLAPPATGYEESDGNNESAGQA